MTASSAPPISGTYIQAVDDQAPVRAAQASIGSLEIGRFLAASLVVMTHFWPDMKRFAADPAQAAMSNVHMPGATAVQYFFVLSGFVMMTAHFKDFGRLSSVPKFWWRRVCRIYPTYWLGLLICIYYLYGFLNPLYSFELFSLSPNHVSDMVGPAWTLRYEVAFYCFFGFCLLPYVGRLILIAWVYSVFAVWTPQYISILAPPEIQRLLGDATYRYAGDFISPFEFYFFAGLVCGWVYKRFILSKVIGFFLIAVGVIGLWRFWAILDAGHGFGSPADAPMTGIFFGFILLGLAGLETARVIRFGMKARLLGMLSYPLYILHAPIMAIVDNQLGAWLRLGPLRLWLFSISLFCAVYFICGLITFLFDQPIQRLLRRIGEKMVLRSRRMLE